MSNSTSSKVGTMAFVETCHPRQTYGSTLARAYLLKERNFWGGPRYRRCMGGRRVYNKKEVREMLGKKEILPIQGKVQIRENEAVILTSHGEFVIADRELRLQDHNQRVVGQMPRPELAEI